MLEQGMLNTEYVSSTVDENYSGKGFEVNFSVRLSEGSVCRLVFTERLDSADNVL